MAGAREVHLRTSRAPAGDCPAARVSNGNGALGPSDAVYPLAFLFLGGLGLPRRGIDHLQVHPALGGDRDVLLGVAGAAAAATSTSTALPPTPACSIRAAWA